MLEALQQIDQAWSLAINQSHSANTDVLMKLVSGKITWTPLYAALLYLLQKIFGWKRTLILLLAIVLNVVITDQVSVMMKFGFERLRPCHSPELEGLLHMVVGCGGKYGFVSSHAANTMGLAVLISLILKNRWMTLGMITFGLLNGYSRVYLGKHYVFDVLGGFVLGALSAWVVYQLLIYLIKRFKL
jgi:undecaprenyl-diphosphatase